MKNMIPMLSRVTLRIPLCVMFAGSCGQPPTGDSEAIIDQGVLFHFSYENFAWSHQSSGWYVDDRGNLWNLTEVHHWWPEQMNIVSGERQELLYDQNTLEETYIAARDTIIATIDRAELLAKYGLIANAARGAYSIPVVTGNDIGSFIVGYLYYDTTKGKYEKVILSIAGDWSARNLDPSAVELDTWLRGLAERYVPRNSRIKD